jgi:cell division transport system ATP-binding protein
MIKFEDVSKSYESHKTSIQNVNLEIKQGEFVTLVGHSGAGKSTLIKLLLTEKEPTSGVITFDGVNIHKLRKADVPHYRQRIGVVFQDYKLLESRTVFENVAFAMEMIGKSNDEIENDVPNVLELVGLEDKSMYFPSQLSGGEQQRLSIARAIINQPDVLIADEPTDSLDPENVGAVVQILKKINELGTTVILATHNKEVVKELNQRIVSIEKGKIIKDTKKSEK